MNEKVFHIPKNLNSEFSFVGCYSLSDIGIILVALLLSIFGVVTFKNINFIIFPIALLVLKFKLSGYSVFYWFKTSLSFLFAKFNKKHKYILFERAEIKWK